MICIYISIRYISISLILSTGSRPIALVEACCLVACAGTTVFELATGKILFTGKTNNQMAAFPVTEICSTACRCLACLAWRVTSSRVGVVVFDTQHFANCFLRLTCLPSSDVRCANVSSFLLHDASEMGKMISVVGKFPERMRKVGEFARTLSIVATITSNGRDLKAVIPSAFVEHVAGNTSMRMVTS